MTRGMVTSKKIDERKMGYRGSKSDVLLFIFFFNGIIVKQLSVKEQRADASSYNLIYVRCALVAMKVVFNRSISMLKLKLSQ